MPQRCQIHEFPPADICANTNTKKRTNSVCSTELVLENYEILKKMNLRKLYFSFSLLLSK